MLHTHVLVLLKNSTDTHPKYTYFMVDEDTVTIKQRLPTGGWSEDTYNRVQARKEWKQYIRLGWICNKHYDINKKDQSLPMSEDNCRHRTRYKGKCNACGAIV